MYQSFILPEQDVVAFRSALANPLYAPLCHQVPSLARALAHPQPDFTENLGEISYAISEVCSNTKYPEDWDDLRAAVDETRAARQAFFADKSAPVVPDAASPSFFVLVREQMGSNDGATFRPHVFADFNAACKALKAWTDAEFAEEPDDEDFSLDEYASPEHGTYGINLLSSGHSVVCQYFLQKFTFAPVTGGAA